MSNGNEILKGKQYLSRNVEDNAEIQVRWGKDMEKVETGCFFLSLRYLGCLHGAVFLLVFLLFSSPPPTIHVTQHFHKTSSSLLLS